MKKYLLIIILACMSFMTYAQIRQQTLSTAGLPITFDVLLADPDERYAYVPPGECAPFPSCMLPGSTGYSCDIPSNGAGQYQDFWIEIWVPGSTWPFYLFCRFSGSNTIYITRSDHSWQLALPDPEQDVLAVTPPSSIGSLMTIDFDRPNGHIHVGGLKPGHVVYVIPPCGTIVSGDESGETGLRTSDTTTNPSLFAHRTSSGIGLNKNKEATVTTQELSHPLLRFPNPISSSLTIIWGNEAPADTELSLWSLDGRRLAQGRLEASAADYTFPMAHLPAGIYLLRMTSTGHIPQTYKVVKN
jgi:hypothetical protein